MTSFVPDVSARVEVPGQPYLIWFISTVAILLLYQWSTRTDVSFIRGLPEIPGSVPLFGHLLQLGDDHASVCEKWWQQYHQSIFQIRLGNTRAVVVNSFDDVKRMLIGHQSALIDRPTLYTFHGVISSTQGFTIGSSPWDTSCKNKRKAAGQALGRPAIRGYFDMFDLESYCIVRDLHKQLTKDSVGTSSVSSTESQSESDVGKFGKSDRPEIFIRPYIQRYALNTTLTLCYGIRMDDAYDAMLREILEVGSAISLLRSASENYQDYVPLLRYFPNNEKTRRSKELRDRRDKYLNFLLDKVRDMIQRGTDKPCISAAILKDQETKLTGVEVSSICLSLVSGGFETIPGTLTSCIGSLATKEGQVWQDRAFDEMRRYYEKSKTGPLTPNSTLDEQHSAEADRTEGNHPEVEGGNDWLSRLWLDSFRDEKIPYVNAIVKEAARYYTVSAMSLPRKTVSDVEWESKSLSGEGIRATIPKGTMVLINAQAANHDIDHFGGDAKKFDPERWLNRGEEGSTSNGSTSASVSTDLPDGNRNKNADGDMFEWIEKTSTGISHFSFGAGSRACSGQLIAHRLLYTALVRILSCYSIVASDVEPPNTDYVDYNQFKSALVAIPRDFKVKLVPRRVGAETEAEALERIERILKEAEERTREYYQE